MKYFYLALFICSTLQGDEVLSKIIEYALDYREDSALPKNDEKLRQIEIFNKTNEILVDYSSFENLDAAVEAFAQKTLPQGFYYIEKAKLRSGAKDKVYLIKDINKSLLNVIKAFLINEGRRSKFLSEISAMNLLEELDLNPIKPISVGKYKHENQCWNLLFETAAKGTPIKERINENVFFSCGQSLAKLHSQKIPSAMPKKLLDHYNTLIDKILNNKKVVSKISKHLKISDFIQTANYIRDDAASKPFELTFCHGDAHLGNIFFDEEAKCTFIDLDKLHKSIDRNGQPKSNGTADFVRFLASYDNKCKFKSDLKLKAFQEGYGNPEKHLIQFYTALNKFYNLLKFIKYTDQIDLNKRTADKAIFVKAVKFFKNTEVNSKFGNLTRRRPEFEPGVAGAEAAQIE